LFQKSDKAISAYFIKASIYFNTFVKYSETQRVFCFTTEEKSAMVNLSITMSDIQNESIRQTVEKERKRLLEFIRKRVPTQEDAEDVLQDVFYELVNTYRLMKPVEQMASWMFTVARNKITDRYRKKKPTSLEGYFAVRSGDEGERLDIADFLPSHSNSPDTEMMREAITESLMAALEELPQEQREVFIMHEIEDKSFQEISELTGANLNTLLSRKRYAVLFLRQRLQNLYNDLFND
jgi:RNA polymerase sigma factor (sigma-70 family)